MNPPAPATRTGSFGEIFACTITPRSNSDRAGLLERPTEPDDIDRTRVLALGQDPQAIDECQTPSCDRLEGKLRELGPRRRKHDDVGALQQLRDRRAPTGNASESGESRFKRDRVVYVDVVACL